MEISMLKDGHECAPPLPEFLLEAQALLAKSEDCLSHLHLIRNDEEAINCLLASLLCLAQTAARHSISPLAEFALHIHGVLKRTAHPVDLNDPILDALKSCLTGPADQRTDRSSGAKLYLRLSILHPLKLHLCRWLADKTRSYNSQPEISVELQAQGQLSGRY